MKALKDIYQRKYFETCIESKMSDQEVLIDIATKLMGQNAYRINYWAYAGDILWCRDYYGKYYKIPEMVDKIIKIYIPMFRVRESLVSAMSILYITLLMVHPFNDGNGRIIYTFTAFLAYKYQHIFPKIILLKNTDRLHISFRNAEHSAYKKIMEWAQELEEFNVLKFDLRMSSPKCDIGFFDFKSTNYIFFSTKLNNLTFPLQKFFEDMVYYNDSIFIEYRI